MNRRQMVKAGRCRDCGATGGQPHADECHWIGGVCEYQLVRALSLPTPQAEDEKWKALYYEARDLLVYTAKLVRNPPTALPPSSQPQAEGWHGSEKCPAEEWAKKKAVELLSNGINAECYAATATALQTAHDDGDKAGYVRGRTDEAKAHEWEHGDD